jgi:hypothetical protein
MRFVPEFTNSKRDRQPVGDTKKPGGDAGLWTVADTNEGLLRPMWRPAGPGRQLQSFTPFRVTMQKLSAL